MEIAQVFLDTDMRQGFEGLGDILRKRKVNPELLLDRSFIVFMNKACTKFKLLVGKSYIVYYSNENRRIPLEAITRIPEFFDGTKFNIKAAVMKTIEDKVRREVK